MAAAKKSSKKKSSKSKRANACARGGSEMRTIKGTSPRSVRRRSKAAFDLVTCRKARPVKAKKRAPKKRASVKNGDSSQRGYYAYQSNAPLGQEPLGTDKKDIWQDLTTDRGAIMRANRIWPKGPIRIYAFRNFYRNETFRLIYSRD